MSEAEKLADALDNWDGLLMMPIGWRQQTSNALRRLAQVEAEHAALLKAISDAEPVAYQRLIEGPYGDFWTVDSGYHKVKEYRPLYTLNGIKP